MIETLRRTHTIDIEEPLPASWLRVNDTRPDRREDAARNLLRVGPDQRLRARLVNTIREAREVVLVASFLLSDERLADAMLDAALRGVRVYALTASEARLGALVGNDDEFEARMVAEHKKLLDRLAGAVLLRSAEHFHAKLLVTDPRSNPQAWISTANFNKALQESVELGVALPPQSARDLAGWFSWAFWMEAERELVEKGRLAKVGEPPAVPRRPARSEMVVTARDELGLRDAARRIIDSAQRELIVSSYGFDIDHPVFAAIIAKAAAGVPVTVLTRPRPAVAAAVERLSQAGATVLAHDKLHAKGLVTESAGLVMTANLQASGLDRGFEVGIVLDPSTTEALRSTFQDWTARFPWAYASSAPRSTHLGEICLADQGLRTGIREVTREARVPLPPVVAGSALDLDDAPTPELKVPAPRDKFPQQVVFDWEIRPPILPKQAKERLRKIKEERPGKDGKSKIVKRRVSFEPKVYTHAESTYVVLEPGADIEAAAKLADELGAKVVVR